MKKEDIKTAKAETVCDEEAHAEVVLHQERSMDKKIVESEDLAEFRDAAFDMDVMTTEAMRKYPVLRTMPPRAQLIMAASAAGMGQAFIGKALGVSQQAVQKMLKKYDPTRSFALSPDAKKAVMTRLIESKGLEALASITAEKLEESSAKDLTVIAKNLNDVNQSMNASKHKKQVFSEIDAFLSEIPEAEIVEESEK